MKITKLKKLLQIIRDFVKEYEKLDITENIDLKTCIKKVKYQTYFSAIQTVPTILFTCMDGLDQYIKGYNQKALGKLSPFYNAKLFAIAVKFRIYELKNHVSFAGHHWISFDVEDDFGNTTPQQLASATKKVKKLIKKGVPVKWGDLISNKKVALDRNNGLYIWNGKKVVELASKPDDYGSLPEEFTIVRTHPETGEFIHPNYWHNYLNNYTKTERFITHNGYVNFDHSSFRQELLQNIQYSYIPFDPEKKGFWTECLTKYGTLYIVFTNADDNIQNKDETDAKSMIKKFKKILKQDKVYFEVGSYDDMYNYTQDVLVLFINLS